MSEEDELIKDVEEEVKKLLTERRMEQMREKPALSIYYFGSPDKMCEEHLRTSLRNGIVLIALKDGSLNKARRFLEDAARVVKQTGGSIYLVRSPSILIISGLVKLEIRG